ncbi:MULTISPECIES: pilus assembly protein TadG-related protein [unclassified Ornithinimicrobium]|uniref:pilus assembly protein TadG-related protein n=1 Tax=unclassified Ornithinimicrobium TaxID=2615080 RepID=UPI00385231B4
MTRGGGEPFDDRESGQISILVVGMVAVTLTIILSIVAVTSVQLSRIHLLDAADAAALDASDALAEEAAYTQGVATGVPVTSSTVVEAAHAHLASRERPTRLSGWAVGPGTGTPDGRTAVVVLTGTARLPVVTPVLSSFGGGVTITVTSSARSDLDP